MDSNKELSGFLFLPNQYLATLSKFKLHKIRQFIKLRIFYRIDRKILIYLIFVVVSTVFWFLNKLNNEYNTIIEYPIRYTQLPKNKILVNELPQKLKLNVSAYGYDLIFYKISPAPFPIVLNLESFDANLESPKVSNFKLLTRYAREEISNQLPNNINVLDILPDTLVFQFDNMVDKKVPVKANLTLSFAPQCMQNGPVIFKPDSLLVSGPTSLIDTIQAVYTKPQSFTKLDKTFQRTLYLEEITNLKTEKKKVQATIPIAKFTEASFDVPIVPVNVPDTLELITFPRNVRISGLISLADYEMIKAEDFRVQADYNEIETLIGQKMPVQVIVAPSNVRNVTFFPPSVEFILEKKP